MRAGATDRARRPVLQAAGQRDGLAQALEGLQPLQPQLCLLGRRLRVDPLHAAGGFAALGRRERMGQALRLRRSTLGQLELLHLAPQRRAFLFLLLLRRELLRRLRGRLLCLCGRRGKALCLLATSYLCRCLLCRLPLLVEERCRLLRLRQLRAKHLYALFLLLIRRAVLLRLRETRERRRERLPADESALALLMRQPQGRSPFPAGGERLLSLREHCRKLLRRGGLRLREQLCLLCPAVPRPRREIERTLLQPFLEGCIPLRVEERLHELAAPPRIAHEERAELSLRQQHDLSELLAAKARQRLEILRHLARAGDEQFLLAAALRVELRPRPRRALPVLAPIGRTAQHAVAARAEREFHLHPGLCLRRRLVRAQHRTRAQRAARLAIERKADRVEQRRLPRARHAVNEEAAILSQPLREVERHLADIGAECLQAEFPDPHTSSLSSCAISSRTASRYFC